MLLFVEYLYFSTLHLPVPRSEH